MRLASLTLPFALDSIPAVYGLTEEPYIVFVANAFALLSSLRPGRLCAPVAPDGSDCRHIVVVNSASVSCFGVLAELTTISGVKSARVD